MHSILLTTAASGFAVPRNDKFDRFTLGSVNIICTNFAMGVQCDYPTPFAGTTATGNLNHRNIISYDSNGIYALGFHEIVRGEFYLSIYLFYPSDSSAGPPVWTANRDNPVDENATMSFLTTGSLELRDSQGNVKWSSRTEKKGVKSLVFLNDVGSLELLNEANQTVWQTLDDPSDTLVKNQVMRYNAGGQRSVVSSSTPDRRGKGVYSMAMGAGGLVLYVSADRSGALLPYRTYSYYGEKNLHYAVHTCKHPTFASFFPPSSRYGAILQQDNLSSAPASVVDPEMCGLSSSPGAVRGIFDLQRLSNWSSEVNDTKALRLEHDGTLKVYSWKAQALTADNPLVVDLFNEDDPCSLPNVCGPYGICTRSYGDSTYYCTCPLTSRNRPNSFWDQVSFEDPDQGCQLPGDTTVCSVGPSTIQTDFIELDSLDYFANAFATPQLTTAEQCRQQCLQNCSCQAAFYRTSLGQCFLTFHPLLSLRSENSTFLAYLKVITPDSGSSATGLIVGVSVGLGVAILFGVLFAGLCIWRRRKEDRRQNGCKEAKLFLNSLPGLPPRLRLKDIMTATKGFTLKIGEGGFGTVYKGALPDGTEVAVKRLEGAGQGAKEFRAEMVTIGSIHHINLVRLYGFCIEGDHPLLVYEYMANGSLDSHLFPEASDTAKSVKSFLEWKTRMSIASDTAKGLAYLHEDCREQIIHLDIKPQNILLDERFRAKVADFGLSKLVKRNQMGQGVTHLRGTPGYLAPEWLHMPTVTEKADVYSFGIVLLELVSGRRNAEFSLGTERMFFPRWAFQRYKQGKLQEILDCRLEELVNTDEATRMIKVAFWCIQEDPLLRPSMGGIVQMLEGTLQVSELPEIHGYSEDETVVDIIESDFISPSSNCISSDAPHQLGHGVNGVDQRAATRSFSKALEGGLSTSCEHSIVEAR
ncbi:hypothetical protein Mapa_009086 [Marchantia paleacea]|nr:hypothetical protein Mapa_009086 [Marchantia paleacea]